MALLAQVSTQKLVTNTIQSDNLRVLNKFIAPGTLTTGFLSFAVSSSQEVYSFTNTSQLTGSVSSLGLARFDEGGVFTTGSLYLSSLYLGNQGGTVNGKLTTNATGSDIFWNGASLLGGGGVAPEDLISTTQGLQTFTNVNLSSLSTSYGNYFLTSSITATNISSIELVGSNIIAEKGLVLKDGYLLVQNLSGATPITAAFGTSNQDINLYYAINEQVKWSQTILNSADAPLGFVYKQTTELLSLDGSNQRIGILNPHPNYTLDVNGTVNATAFIGDGSGLTNISVGITYTNLLSTVGGLGSAGYISTGGQGYFSSVTINMLPQNAPFWDSNIPIAGADPQAEPLALDVFGSVRVLKNLYIGSTTTVIGTSGIATAQVSSATVLTTNLLLYDSILNSNYDLSVGTGSLLFNGSTVVTTQTGVPTDFVSTPFLNVTLNSTIQGLGTYGYFSTPSFLTVSSGSILTSSVGINVPNPVYPLDVGGTGRFITLSTQALYLSSLMSPVIYHPQLFQF